MPPVPVYPVELASLTSRSRAELSSTFGNFSAALAIDNDLDNYCVSREGVGNWLSIAVPSDTPIGYVAAYNVRGMDRLLAVAAG